MLRITCDQQHMFWIGGFSSQYKFYWYRACVRDEDFQLRSRSRKGGLIIEPDSVKLELFDSRSVALDRFIYTVGGCHPKEFSKGSRRIPQKYIHCLDTSNSEEGWKKLEVEMKMGRQRPQVAALEGKIYIFGGAVRSDSLPPSELLDPVNGKMEVLPNDEYTNDLHLVGVDQVLKRIVFCSHHCLTREQFCSSKAEFSYLKFYNPNKQEWDRETHVTIADHLHELFSCTQVVVGTTIYWLSTSFQIKAYDFVQEKFYFSEELINLTEEGHPGLLGDNVVCSFLFHVKGDCFYLFWDDDEYNLSNYSPIHCTSLQISKNCITNNNNDNLLSVSVLGTQTYLIRGDGFTLTDILPTTAL